MAFASGLQICARYCQASALPISTFDSSSCSSCKSCKSCLGTQIYVRHPEQDALMAFHTDAFQRIRIRRVCRCNSKSNFSSQPFLHRTRAILCAYREATNTRSRQTPSRKACITFLIESRYRQRRFRMTQRHLQPPTTFAERLANNKKALWHRVGPNRTEQVRKSVTFPYRQMWCRPYDNVENDFLSWRKANG